VKDKILFERYVSKTDFSRYLKSQIVSSINHYVAKYDLFNDPDLLMFSFLDPTFKSFDMFSPEEQKRNQKIAIDRIKVIFIFIFDKKNFWF
jgi:hypothetical protein